jgi:probable HAF family extracellular repeat protein
VVGPSRAADGRVLAYVWQAGAALALPTLSGDPGSVNEARGINTGGLIVGNSQTAGGQAHAALWTPL